MDRLPDIMTGSLGAIPAALEHAARFSLCKSAHGQMSASGVLDRHFSLIGLLAVPSLKRGKGIRPRDAEVAPRDGRTEEGPRSTTHTPRRVAKSPVPIARHRYPALPGCLSGREVTYGVTTSAVCMPAT
ncbi:hypothetical protein J2785_003063 [Burkholderia ambifaria]|nr:hypothetical protein [Burkholderia ambifaria]MDR6499907.1 hypothetical protein [Burkholderia ambifaria]